MINEDQIFSHFVFFVLGIVMVFVSINLYAKVELVIAKLLIMNHFVPKNIFLSPLSK